MYMYICVHKHIYINVERRRESERHIPIYICIYILYILHTYDSLGAGGEFLQSPSKGILGCPAGSRAAPDGR